MANRTLVAAGVLALGLAVVLAPSQPLPLPIGVRWLAAYLLFVVLPGWLLVRQLVPARPEARLETAVLALAAGYSLAVLLGLGLHAMFRPIAPWQIATGGGLLVVGLALAARLRQGSHSTRPDLAPGAQAGGSPTRWLLVGSPKTWAVRLGRCWPALLLLAVAAPLRLADLSWSEFQGDEARVVLRALAALQGADGALAAHRKVPGEVLLMYLFAGSLGQIVEQIARLPFALSAVGAVLAFYTLARGLLGGPAALVAGLLLAVNGYFVAFGRILQYDSLAFFLGIAGLLCCWRFGQSARTEAPPYGDTDKQPAASATPDGRTPDGRPVAWALLGSLLIAGAALVALGAIFLTPPALILAWPGLKHHFWPVWPRWPASSWRVLAAWSWPLAPAALAAVLVVSASDPSAGPSGVWSYLGPRFGGDRPYWNSDEFYISANHYLSTPYLLVMMNAGIFAVALGVVESLWAVGSRAVVVRLAVAVGLAALTWDRPRVAMALGALLAFGLAFQAAGTLLGQRFAPSLGLRVALAWAAGPMFVHMLLIRVPGTHWREAFPGLVLVLAALAVPALANTRWRVVVTGLLGLLIVGAGHYSWVTLAQRQPEYQLTYPDDRHPLDWTDREGRGIGGVFGSVHRHGWKTLGVLAADGMLPGGFGTNESPAISAWYVRRPQGCEDALEYVFRVERAPHDRNLRLPVSLPSGYVTRGRVRELGRSTILIQVSPTSSTRFGDLSAEANVARFDAELASAWRPVGELYRADLGQAQANLSCAAQPAIPNSR